MCDMIKIKKSGWTWFVRDPQVLEGWFPDFKALLEKNSIKRNAKRAVFTVDSPSGKLFVKYNSTDEALARLLSYLHPKSRAEVDGAEILRRAGIRTVEVEGWGVRNARSMLITREIKGAVSARNYWFETLSCSESGKSLFTRKLSELVSEMIGKRIFHPDFHLGNLLLLPETMDFAVIDPYGVKKCGSLRNSQIFVLLSIFGALRGELTDAQAEKILKDTCARAGIAKFAEPGSLWRRIVEFQESEMEKSWPKRKRKILSEDPRYVTRMGKWLIRNSITGIPLASEEEISSSSSGELFEEFGTTPEKALDIWAESFRSDFLRRKSRTPVAMRDSAQEYLLLYRRSGE